MFGNLETWGPRYGAEYMLSELDSVTLTMPLPEGGVPVGSQGVVLIVYREPTQAYEMGFFDTSLRSLGTFTTDDSHIEKRQG